MCAAIWLTGLFIQLILFAAPPGDDGNWDGSRWNASTPEAATGRPDAYSVKFMPLAALGGALWATDVALQDLGEAGAKIARRRQSSRKTSASSHKRLKLGAEALAREEAQLVERVAGLLGQLERGGPQSRPARPSPPRPSSCAQTWGRLSSTRRPRVGHGGACLRAAVASERR